MKHIRTSRFSKIIASYLALQLIITTIQPSNLYALTSGPSQPEFNAFTPIGTSDMVNLSSGDFNYNIPIMDVGGYPLNLAYDSGITMDQEASWVGLGWNLNVGQINRQLRGLPDDFNGDEMTYENNLRPNFTAGVATSIEFPIYGYNVADALGANLNVGLGMEFNNYNGITFNFNYGASFDISESLSAGLNITSASDGSASVTPSVGLKMKKNEDDECTSKGLTTTIGVPFNSRQGLTGLSLSASAKGNYENLKAYESGSFQGGKSSFITFNDNLSYTPTNQLSFVNLSLALNFGLGLELFGSEGPQLGIDGYGSLQQLRDSDKNRKVNGFGYAHTENAPTLNSVLDFNRENDRTVTTNTTMLPIVNQTYDLYSINGQGVSGMFRAHRSQIGHVFDETIISSGRGGSVGYEFGPGLAGHFGADVKVNPSFTKSGRWENSSNTVLNKFKINNNEAEPTQKMSYEPVYYKTIGELTADEDTNYTSSIISEKNPVKIGLGGTEYNRSTDSNYKVKNYNQDNSVSYNTSPLSKIKRSERETRTQSIQMIKYGDVKPDGEGKVPDGQIRVLNLPSLLNDGSDYLVPDSHHVGAKILQPDGSTYVYGETAYNTRKIEASFATNNQGNCLTGLVTYNTNENSRNNTSGRSHYYNKIETPAYAHTYLLTSVLSSDYEDLTNDGPTDDDLGAYTKFTYTKNNYNWRVPFSKDANVATYSEGLLTDSRDQKASFLYGSKELKYIDIIETKTHIAKFFLTNRADAIGVSNDQNGGAESGRMKKIDSIHLYSKPEYLINPATAVPIKAVHFEYNYSLCANVNNNTGENVLVNGTDINIDEGKLTLSKVYFTYGKSKMGQYTPYEFHYDSENPDYNIKAYDVWGNYKPIAGGCGPLNVATTPEFPFVQQDNKPLQDGYASAWTLTSIDLPSGGKLQFEFESDDYGYVQDKQAMQMFKVVGAGNSSIGADSSNRLYDGSDDFDFIYIKIDNSIQSPNEFIDKYLKDIGQSDANPLYFKFMLNMTPQEYDYVSGYALVDREASQIFEEGGEKFASIKLKRVKREGGIINSNQMVNPIAKAGWYFGRTYLNRQIYNIQAGENDGPGNLLALGQNFLNAIGSVETIFSGPNQALRNKNCAQRFSQEKSWIRLYHPDDTKLGGGSRVKKLELHDNWDSMNNQLGNNLYKNYYGQEYDYKNVEGGSSGVATFEPNGSHENPLVLPFYDKNEKLIAPKESNYTEKPIGQSLYPYPTVTYGRVVVSNLKREREVTEGETTVIRTLKKHATGKVINEFYTSKNFPTIADFTDITPKVDITGILGTVLKVRTQKSLTYSQGFVVRTNDMNGKVKSQTVQSEGQSGAEFISKVVYKYSVNDDGTLKNNLNIIKDNGEYVENTPIGVSYDMVNDFRHYYNRTKIMGVDGNLAAILVFIGILPAPTFLPVLQTHEQELKTATTTKVIHSVGILKEKIAYDLGSKVSTENLAWDANTGNVLLTKTVNEYGDYYYNLNYPSNWYYNNMGAASNNLGTKGFISLNLSSSETDYNIYNPVTNSIVNPNTILTLGDELIIRRKIPTLLGLSTTTKVDRVWVSGFSGNNLYLIDEVGQPFDLDAQIIGKASFEIYRSGFRNLLSATMASITLQENPIVDDEIALQTDWANLNVVNASAVEYNDAWNTQCEFRLPNPNGVEFDEDGNVSNYESIGFNPYLYNVKGDWRAVKSYAYLTSRNNSQENFNPRKEGFFDMFKPFYKRQGNNWVIDNPNPLQEPENRWTFASEVTQYSPYGAELENIDALDRYSAAQYGYRYTLPTAVGSNTQYRELAFDGFEDYEYAPLNGNTSDAINPHFGFQDEVVENANATITDETSHSGRNSIKLSAGATAKIKHRLIDCDTINSLPIANNDAYTSYDCRSYAMDVLSNDDFGSDGSGSISILSPPTNGAVVLNTNGTSTITDDYFTYSGTQGTSDSFTYEICDSSGDCDVATVNISCSIMAKSNNSEKN